MMRAARVLSVEADITYALTWAVRSSSQSLSNLGVTLLQPQRDITSTGFVPGVDGYILRWCLVRAEPPLRRVLNTAPEVCL